MELLSIAALVIFWASSLGILQTYLFYPALLRAFTSDRPPVRSPSEWPSTTLVIAAYNEEDVIEEKIENSLELDYPDDKFDIVVFSDASSDRTDDLVKGYADEGVELMRIEGRVGKTECQNQVTSRLDSDFIVYSDANSMYEPAAIKRLIARFSDGVGCVVGELRYSDDSDVEGESLYWRYEQAIKKLEARFHSLVTGNGSIYAVRRSSYVPLSPGGISDFAEPLAVVSNGEKIDYADDAVAWERTGESVESEMSRRIRIVTRCWNTVTEFTELLNPLRYPRFAFQFISHKILRWLSPLLLGTAFVANAVLLLLDANPIYTLSFAVQVLFYFSAVLGWVSERYDVAIPGPVHVTYYFIVSNVGMVLGLWKFLKGQNIVTWETADRTG
ncbi:glycosyltransferase family 2 protein (plasmid) [Haladaptatus sp. SPP-AMP-3]|uniref:glycosyltransferase family 2 protein n=1 Tax=Haladaptatus sp. SPP-AMP-3 TaxID=3121295 RepID=UPI003C2AACFC